MFTQTKEDLIPKKGVILGFGRFPLKPLFLLFFLGFHCFGPPKKCAKQKVCTETRAFLPSWHKWCQTIFPKNPFCHFSHFLDTHLKNTIFICLAFFHFVFFWSLLQQHKKTITEMHFFENLIFDIPTIKKHILAQIDTICVFQHPQNTL